MADSIFASRSQLTGESTRIGQREDSRYWIIVAAGDDVGSATREWPDGMTGAGSASLRPDGYPPMFESPFDLGRVNPEITLLEGRAVLRKGKQSLALSKGRVVLSARPSWKIRFDATGRSSDPVVLKGVFGQWRPPNISFPDERARGTLHEETLQFGGDLSKRPQGVRVSGDFKQIQIGRARRLKSVLFHLPNFPEFHGSPITDGSGVWAGRIELRAGDWHVALDARRGLSELIREIREEGGFAITHVGRLDKGGTPFSREEAEEVLAGLPWFLSFVRGAWTSPTVLVGKAARRGAAWQLLNVGRTDRWSGAFRWCDPTAWTSAYEAYQGYTTLWSRPEWQHGLRVAIGQYISANKPNPLETAIIAAQSGLELLGWLHFVESNKVPAQRWRNPRTFPAERKIRDLIGIANVDPAIPSLLSSLPGLNRQWKDGPAVVAGVRNRLVHPRRVASRIGWAEEVLVETWLLATRYLELTLLHALGVKSGIRDRLGKSKWVGSTVTPPWV